MRPQNSPSQPLSVLPIVGGEVVLFADRLEVAWTRYKPVPKRMYRSFAIKELEDFKLFDTAPFVKGALRITTKFASKEALLFLYSHRHDMTAESLRRYLEEQLRDRDVLPIVRTLAG